MKMIYFYKSIRFGFIFTMFLLLQSTTNAQVVYDNQTVSGVWNSTQEIHIQNTVYVTSGTTLTIEPGTHIKFKSGAKMTIQGTILVNGTINSPVIFTSLDTAMASRGAGLEINASANASFVFSYFSYFLKSTDGGAIYVTNSSSVNLKNCRFESNHTSQKGGAVFANSSTVNMININLLNNASALTGGAIASKQSTIHLAGSFIGQNEGYGLGTIISLTNTSKIFLTHTTFTNNLSLDDGPQIYIDASSEAYIRNSILYDNYAGLVSFIQNANTSKNLKILNSLIRDPARISGMQLITGEKIGSPEFLNPNFEAGTTNMPFETFDYRLKKTSQTINAGLDTTITGYDKDLDGLPRNNLTSDMGAYEYFSQYGSTYLPASSMVVCKPDFFVEGPKANGHWISLDNAAWSEAYPNGIALIHTSVNADFYLRFEENRLNFDERRFTVGAPDANYYVSMISGSDVTFQNSGTPEPLTTYDFGDGSKLKVSPDPSYVRTYQADKAYQAKIYVKKNDCIWNTELYVNTSMNGDCNPEFHFDDNVLGADGYDIVSAYWDLGNGQTFEGTSISGSDFDDGVYDITLTAEHTNGCITSKTKRIVKGNLHLCNARFDIYPDGKIIYFQSNSNLSGLTYLWDFGDGSASNKANPTHSYDAGGSYTVSLNVVGYGKKDRYSLNITVDSIDCKADFNYKYDPQDSIVSFQANAQGGFSYVYWNFGNGKASTDLNPSMYFPHDGIYPIAFISYDIANECMSKIVKNISIGENSLRDCEADFLYTVDSANMQVNFFSNSVGNNLQYYWNFGNGTYSSLESPSVTFTTAGIYNVCLKVLNPHGISNLSCKPVEVPGVEEGSVLVDFDLCLSNTGNNLYIKTGKGLKRGSLYWDFGDGQTANGVVDWHTYAEPGLYMVTLCVFDPTTNKTYTKSKMANVNAQCNDDCVKVISPGLLCGTTSHFKASGYPVDFIGGAFGDPAKATWDFGDGTIDSTTLTPTHEYEEGGTYQVCLTISDPITGESSINCYEVIGLGTPDISKTMENLLVYPVPVKQTLTVHYASPRSGKVEIEIYDVFARKIKQYEFDAQQSVQNTFQLNVSDLTNGVYFLGVTNGHQMDRIKFVYAQ